MSNCTQLPVVFSKDIIINDRFYSCERQDEFVYHVLAKYLKDDGFFLDVACGHPLNASNTYVLEKYCGWSGIGFDIGLSEEWYKYRISKFVQMDVLGEQFTNFLKDNVNNKIVDYISLDVDNAGKNYSLQTLIRIINSGVTFKVMTLEHESFKTGNSVTDESRKILESLGYVLLFKDVCFNNGDPWEDWWVNPELLPNKEVLKVKDSNINYNSCIEKLRNI